jgi:hypothetical protein
VQSLCWENLFVVFRRDDLDLLRLRAKDANDQVIARAMGAEDAERIRVRPVQQGGDLIRIDRVNGKRTHRSA